MGVSDKMFLNLLVIVLPALASANCPAGTFMFEQDSKCLSLADHCFNQNKLIRADLRGCGKKCERDEEPQIHTNKCINLHCKLYTNSGLNQEQRCVPCPEGMTTSEDGKSCVERSSWGECKLEAEKTRSVSCEGPFLYQIPSTETEQCGDLMTKKLDALFLEMNMMKSKIEVQDRKISDLDKKISDLEKKISNLQRDNAIKDQKISTLQSDNLNIKERIAQLMSGKINIDQKISNLKTKITTLETEKNVQEDEITALGSRITTENKNLQGKLSKIENKPYAFQCAYQGYWTAANSIITWDRFTVNSMSGVTGGLSLSSGEFTVGHSGIWEVTYSIDSYKDSGEYIWAYLYINGRELRESQYYTGYWNSEGNVRSLGSKTLFIKLNKGDKVTLQTSIMASDVIENTLCFHLAHPFPVSDESVSEEISASVSHFFQFTPTFTLSR